jgi:hypothetical protein
MIGTSVPESSAGVAWSLSVSILQDKIFSVSIDWYASDLDMLLERRIICF